MIITHNEVSIKYLYTITLTHTSNLTDFRFKSNLVAISSCSSISRQRKKPIAILKSQTNPSDIFKEKITNLIDSGKIKFYNSSK